MKKIFVGIFYVSLLIPLSTLSQSKQETIDWLNQKFIEHQFDPGFMPMTYKVSIKLNHANNPMIMIYIPNIKSYYMVNPKDIARVYTERPPSGNLNINITSHERLILTGTINLNNLEPVDYTIIDKFNILLDGPDEEIIRMKKGIEHLVTTLGGNLASDDLFK
tara:strand:- start:19726 stop:20214 length:489 start_codon:yes stop_codon:yes gene_type:complete